MSLVSRAVLWAACGLTLTTVAYVHYKQWADKQKLHEGVLRDVERQQKRKVENLYFLQQQIEMGKILKNQEMKDDAVALKLIEESKKGTSTSS